MEPHLLNRINRWIADPDAQLAVGSSPALVKTSESSRQFFQRGNRHLKKARAVLVTTAILAKPHHEIENDPRVWGRIATLIDAKIFGSIHSSNLTNNVSTYGNYGVSISVADQNHAELLRTKAANE